MRAIPVIVVEVGTYQSDKMALPEDNNVLEQLAPAAADPAFSHGILVWSKYSCGFPMVIFQ